MAAAIVSSAEESMGKTCRVTIVKCALFIATENGELGDECKDIWHVQTQDENSGESSGRVARTMNCVTV